VRAPEADELAHGDPLEAARENALQKAVSVAEDVPEHVVLGADTVVALDGRILPKPRDRGQAEEWLRALSGRRHDVIGAICVVDQGSHGVVAHAVTGVRFRALEDADIDWYLASGEWRDRAGGYAIQGKGAALVEGIEGDYLNVVGLPVGALLGLVPELIRPPG
jgi:nucleoside triphosphate pyrophosphatase